MSGRPKGSKNETFHKWTEEERNYLKQITPGRHYKEIVELMNSNFEYQFTMEQISAAIKRYGLNTGLTGRFEKGNIPVNKGTKGIMKANKGSFKKGQACYNRRSVGSERVDRDGYTLVKVAEPNKWRLKHQIVWEEHNGPIGKGNAVIFADGNKKNLDINNLILVSRKQLLILNNKGLIRDNAELTRTGVIIAGLYQKISSKRGDNH